MTINTFLCHAQAFSKEITPGAISPRLLRIRQLDAVIKRSEKKSNTHVGGGFVYLTPCRFIEIYSIKLTIKWTSSNNSLMSD
jgi:hypothetical protein